MIVVAGGGIAGLTFAVAWQRRGGDVVVLERQPEVREAGAGISLWPNALAALDAVGLGDEIRPVGRPCGSGGTRKHDGRPGLTFSRRAFRSALGEDLLCVHRGELVATLAGMLEPGTLRTGVEVVSYELAGGAVRVVTADGEDMEATGLVGADGIGSAVALQVAGPLPYRYSGYTAWRGTAAGVPDPHGEGIWAHLAGGHEIGWLPLTGGRTYWFATSCLPEGGGPPRDDVPYLEELFERWPEPVPSLLRSTADTELVRNDIVDRPAASCFAKGPVALVGDAAHPMRPHLGQGGCQAIEDAAVLARCLVATSDPATAFSRYDASRRRRATRVARLSRRSGFTRPAGTATRLADRASALAPSVPIGPLLRALAPIAGYGPGAKAVGTSA